MKLIPKDTLVMEIENLLDKGKYHEEYDCAYRDGNNGALYALKAKIDTLEVKNPYEQCVQYDSIKAGIQAHAETYSFNIESLLFNQLTKEQQALWRKEIEQAVISGGEMGVELAKDMRYKENLEVKEADLENIAAAEWDDYVKKIDGEPKNAYMLIERNEYINLAKHFFEFGLKAQKGE